MTDNQDTENKKKIDRSKIQSNCFASAALAINKLHGRGRLLDAPTLMDELTESAQKVTKGDITEIEQMLMTQAKTLDYIFYDALNQLADLGMINQIEVFTNIAFRAQTQCRKTLAVLAELKHPRRTTFIKQQNNAINQQVNNAAEPKSDKIENSEKVANELIAEVIHEPKKMDIGTTSNPISSHSERNAVATFYRPED